VSTYLLYGITGGLLIVSLIKNREKTKKALLKAWRAFENILPEILVMILLVGVLLAFVNAEIISSVIGAKSGWLGVLFASVVGGITLIPGFVAFPMAALLLQNGAGVMQIGSFVSSLMMVGVVTAPVEMKYFGKKLTILRNVFAFGFGFLVALVLGWAVSGI